MSGKNAPTDVRPKPPTAPSQKPEPINGSRQERRTPRWVYGLTLLPLFPLLLAMALALPLNDPRVADLTGTWEVFENQDFHIVQGSADTTKEYASSKSIVLPGPFSRQGLSSGEVWLRKRVILHKDTKAHAYTVTFGNSRSGIAVVYLNGFRLAADGVMATRFKMEQAAFVVAEADVQHIKEGQNEVVIHVVWQDKNIDGLLDHRMVIGPAFLVTPWAERNRSFKNFFELGACFFFPFAMLILVLLSQSSASKSDRSTYLRVLFIVAAALAYLMGKTGLLFGFWRTIDDSMMVIGISVYFIGWSVLEFTEHYTLGHITAAGKANRLICAFAFLLHLTGFPAYKLFAPYLFISLLYGFLLLIRFVYQERSFSGVFLLTAFASMIFSGLNDVGTDIGWWISPRLFTFAIANVGVVATLIAIVDFLEIANNNQQLSFALENKSEELADALVAAKEATRLKSEFLANTSHELRTPLNTIINVPEGLLEHFETVTQIQCQACGSVFEPDTAFVLASDMACPDCEEVGDLIESPSQIYIGDPINTQRYLESILHSGRELLSVVNDVLDFSKIEAGHMLLKIESISLAAFLRALKEKFDSIARADQVRLSFPELLGEETCIDADRMRLQQILSNLLSNAIKFSDKFGEVRLTINAQQNKVCFSVTDQGAGIAARDQEMIFESFRQVDAGHTRQFGGTGLGLAITRGLAHLHGGTVALQSELGHGSTFTVCLPSSVEEAPSQKRAL